VSALTGRIAGTVVAGHGVASGRAVGSPAVSPAVSPYPAGSIQLQQPFFLQAGIDLTPYFSGTLNVDVAPCLAHDLARYAKEQGHVIFDGRLRWFGDIEERFVLSTITVTVGARDYDGLCYYPDPATKPAHRQRDTVVELLLPFIAEVASGDVLAIQF